jgi:hypothetical protein
MALGRGQVDTWRGWLSYRAPLIGVAGTVRSGGVPVRVPVRIHYFNGLDGILLPGTAPGTDCPKTAGTAPGTGKKSPRFRRDYSGSVA